MFEENENNKNEIEYQSELETSREEEVNASRPSEPSYQENDFPMNGQNFTENLQQKSGNKSPLIIVAVIIALALIAGGVMYAMGVFKKADAVDAESSVKAEIKTDIDRIMVALKNYAKEEKAEFFQRVKIHDIQGNTQDIDPMTKKVLDLAKTFSIEWILKSDIQADQFELKGLVHLKDMDILNLLYKKDKKNHFLSLPELLPKSLFANEEELEKYLSGSEMQSFRQADNVLATLNAQEWKRTFSYLLPLLEPSNLDSFKTLDKAGYSKKWKDYMNSNITKKDEPVAIMAIDMAHQFPGNTYVLSENLGDMATFYMNMLMDLMSDENLYPFVEEYLVRIFKELEKQKDLQIFNYVQLSAGHPERIKTAWDDEIKTEFTKWKTFILDGLKDSQERFKAKRADANYESQKKEMFDQFAKLKEANLEIVQTFVVEKSRLNYHDITISLDFSKILKLANTPIGNFPVAFVKYGVESAILSRGDKVTFNPIDKADAFIFTEASEQELQAFLMSFQAKLMDLVFSLQLF